MGLGLAKPDPNPYTLTLTPEHPNILTRTLSLTPTRWGADPAATDAEGKSARDAVTGADSFSVRMPG